MSKIESLNILAIGGGRIYEDETKTLDSFAFSLFPNESKTLTIIPTASNDRSDYVKAIRTAYEKLGATAIVMDENILGTEPGSELLAKSSAIYIGGGDIAYLLEKIKNTNTASELIKFAQKGKIVIGMSAGCGALFEKTIFVKDGKVQVVSGLGIIKGVVLPHYDLELLESCKKEVLGELNGHRSVYGICNGSALYFTGQNQYKAVQERHSLGVWKLFVKSGIVQAEQVH